MPSFLAWVEVRAGAAIDIPEHHIKGAAAPRQLFATSIEGDLESRRNSLRLAIGTQHTRAIVQHIQFFKIAQ